MLALKLIMSSTVIPITLRLIFLLLFSTFKSVHQAVLILSNIPLALVGSILRSGSRGEYLSVPASVGFIALLEIVVLNGVVMITYFNQLRDRGVEMVEAVLKGSMQRLRLVGLLPETLI